LLLILALKKQAVHNAITRINDSLMQSKSILIGVTSSDFLFSEISVIISNKILLFFSKGVWGSAVSSPSGVRGGAPEAKVILGLI